MPTAANRTPATLPAGVSLERTHKPELTCPNCESRGLTIFYRVESVPVHSCLLMPTREAALAYPRGQLALAWCDSCSFITNAAFDPRVHEYSVRYEETQGFSPTFRRFAEDLAKRMVTGFSLQGKTALEVGCGKGEFLAMLVEQGMASGVGLDPAYRPERLNSTAKDRLRFIQDFYCEKYTHLDADLICCRHTLEHIHQPAEFMRTIRRAAGDRFNTLMFFEVPDVVRELKEGAFWDLYYEHCSYFSPASLARVFDHANFLVHNVWLEFADQYLMLTGYPAAAKFQPTPPTGMQDPAEVCKLIEASTETFRESLTYWYSQVTTAAAKGERVVLWGSGSKAVSFLTTLALRDEVSAVVDINPHRQGTFIAGSGHAIVAPESIKEIRPSLVIVMNPIYTPEITAQIDSMGVKTKVVGLGT
ncbi:MAG TPA: class I SAM-dependent methyltransferase [Phycisphaerales bacterium]|nr:class I SAM-dependent methyltransferase [Phycisphaerales bacterium]